MKHVTWYMFTALVFSGVILISGCKAKQQKKRGKIVRVTLSKLQKKNFQEHIPIKGNVEPVEFATISAKTEGVLEDLKVDEGMHLKKGDVLFSIDRVNLENDFKVKKEEIDVAITEIATSEVELQLAKTRKGKAEQDFSRADKLNRKGVISTTSYESEIVNRQAMDAELRKCEIALRFRRAKLSQAKTYLKIAEKKFRDAVVTAPFDCLISEKFKEENEYVKAGENILKIENVSQLQVVAYVSAVYHSRIQVGKTTVLISADEEQYGRGKVTYCSETIDPVTRTFKIKVLLPKDTRLKSGMLCNLDIILREQVGYGLPESAILQLNRKFYVYTATPDNKAKAVEIKKGIVDGADCQIQNPAKLMNAKILVAGQRFVNDGDQLSIAE